MSKNTYPSRTRWFFNCKKEGVRNSLSKNSKYAFALFEINKIASPWNNVKLILGSQGRLKTNSCTCMTNGMKVNSLRKFWSNANVTSHCTVSFDIFSRQIRIWYWPHGKRNWKNLLEHAFMKVVQTIVDNYATRYGKQLI